MGKKDEILQKLRSMIPEDAICLDEENRSGIVLSAQVPVENLRDAVSACDTTKFYLESITGLDFQDTAELVYHLNCYEPKSRIALRVLCGHDQPLPTVSDIFLSAQWLEREVHDFFGTSFTDNPDLRPLLLAEDMDYHPLLKTFGKANAHLERKGVYGDGEEPAVGDQGSEAGVKEPEPGISDTKETEPKTKEPEPSVKEPKAGVKEPKAGVKTPKAAVKKPKAGAKKPKASGETE